MPNNLVHGVYTGTLYIPGLFDKPVKVRTKSSFASGKRNSMGPSDSVPVDEWPTQWFARSYVDATDLQAPDRVFITDQGEVFQYFSNVSLWYHVGISELEMVLL